MLICHFFNPVAICDKVITSDQHGRMLTLSQFGQSYLSLDFGPIWAEVIIVIYTSFNFMYYSVHNAQNFLNHESIENFNIFIFINFNFIN